ncbi:MAG: SIMPL domain-containing protein [Fimbriimonadia bacterium]|jgi:hypothetical protein
MSEFQKALLRFLYVVFVVVIALVGWSMLRPAAKAEAATPVGPDLYGRPIGVTATGTCIVRTKPEFAEVTIGVYQSQTTAKAAKDYVKSTCARILSTLGEAGVSSKDIKTQRFALASEWIPRSQDAKKWNCEESFRVRIRDLNRVAEIVDSAVKVGANRVGGLVYSVEDVSKIRAAGRGKAAETARKKAAELAKALGGKLGRLTSCNEGYPYDYGRYGGYYGYAPASPHAQTTVDLQPGAEPEDAEEVTIQPGDLVTTVVVTATYEVE